MNKWLIAHLPLSVNASRLYILWASLLLPHITIHVLSPLLARLLNRVVRAAPRLNPAAAIFPAGVILVPTGALLGVVAKVLKAFILSATGPLHIVSLWKCTRLFWPATPVHPAVLARLI